MPTPILSNMFYISKRYSAFQDLVCVVLQWTSYTIGWDSASGSVYCWLSQQPCTIPQSPEDSWRATALELHWNLKEGSSNAGEGGLWQQHGVTCQREWREAGKEQSIPSSQSFHTCAAAARCWPYLGLSALNSVVENTPSLGHLQLVC